MPAAKAGCSLVPACLLISTWLVKHCQDTVPVSGDLLWPQPDRLPLHQEIVIWELTSKPCFAFHTLLQSTSSDLIVARTRPCMYLLPLCNQHGDCTGADNFTAAAAKWLTDSVTSLGQSDWLPA